MNSTPVPSFIEFVLSGKIGGLRPGMTRDETLKLFGSPLDWVGKPPNIGFQSESYEESDVWFYHHGSSGIRFGKDDVAVETLVYLEKIKNCPEPFAGWPIQGAARLGVWRLALLTNGISFREPDPENLNYWIVAAEKCVAFGFPFLEGNQLHGHDRSVEYVGTFSTAEEMLRTCKFLSL